MTFKEVLAQVIDWLQQDKRVSYRALKRQFALDDPFLEDLKYELTAVQQCAVDQDGTVLVWTGDASATARPSPPPRRPLPCLPQPPDQNRNRWPTRRPTWPKKSAPPVRPWKASASRSRCSLRT